MQDHYPAEDGVRPRRVCDKGQTESVSGRLFLCLACRCQAVICRCCDRGQVYCSGDCARRARRQSLQAAARRYQASFPGRRTHAARMGRYRAWQERVTHHGSPTLPPDDFLPDGAIAATSDTVSPAEQPRHAASHFHWCGRPCLAQLHHGFLPRRDRHRRRVDHARTERKPPR